MTERRLLNGAEPQVGGSTVSTLPGGAGPAAHPPVTTLQAAAAGASSPSSAAQAYDFVVTHRLDGFTSGVARFNQILAERLGLPLRFLFDEQLPRTGRPFLSFKISEFKPPERDRLAALLDTVEWSSAVYLHDFQASLLEERIVREAERVFCGNRLIEKQVRSLTSNPETVWSPGLILDSRHFEPTAVSVFLFGMAHKIQSRMFARLRALLDSSGHTYAVYVSSANHETASMKDGEIVFDQMREIFPRHLYFLGNLSDVSVYNYLLRSTFFSAFFPGGVRDNNGTVAAAMEHGAVVVTNLDEHSPSGLVHLENVIDINQCDTLPTDPLTLRSISVNAMKFARSRSWDHLLETLTRPC